MCDADVPPDGWYPFGTLVETDWPLEFSAELDGDELPLWERPMRR